MHTLYFTALFALLHSLAFPINTAAALGINCRGSPSCGSYLFVAQFLLKAIMDIDPDQLYNNRENIACIGNSHYGYVCAFLQHLPSGATGRDIQRLAQYILDHGCVACGSVPFNYPSDNDVSNGELTFNYVSGSASTPSAQATTATSTSTSTSTPPSTTSTPTSVSGSASSSTSTVEPSSASPPSPSLLSSLLSCRPCGNNDCTYTPQQVLGSPSYDLLVGTPIANCDPSSNSTLQETIAGSVSIANAWSESVSIGVGLGPLNITASFGRSTTNTIQWSQSVSASIPPGQMGSVIVQVLYNQTQGIMDLGNGQTFPLISNQPLNVEDYSVAYVPCGTSFAANISGNVTCATKSGAPGQFWDIKLNVMVAMVLAALVTSVV